MLRLWPIDGITACEQKRDDRVECASDDQLFDPEGDPGKAASWPVSDFKRADWLLTVGRVQQKADDATKTPSPPVNKVFGDKSIPPSNLLWSRLDS